MHRFDRFCGGRHTHPPTQNPNFNKLPQQELAEQLGLAVLKQRFNDPYMEQARSFFHCCFVDLCLLVAVGHPLGGSQQSPLHCNPPRHLNQNAHIPLYTQKQAFAGLFPKHDPRATRFAINFFVSIGLGT